MDFTPGLYGRFLVIQVVADLDNIVYSVRDKGSGQTGAGEAISGHNRGISARQSLIVSRR